MTNDRRQQERTALDKFAFIQIDRDEGGKVLNLSQGGLCFEVFSPQELGRPVYFWFSLDLSERIEGVGEVAWTDAARRTGGLKFISLSDKARAQLLAGLNPASPPNRRDVDRQRQNPSREPAHPPTFTLLEAPRPTTALQQDAPGRRPNSHAQPDSAPPDPAHLVPFERYHSGLRRQLIRGVLLGILISAVVVGAAFNLALSRKDHVAVQPASEQRVETNAPPPAESLPSLTVSNPGQTSSPPPSANAPRTTASSDATDNPPQSALAPRRMQSLALSSANQPPSMSARLQADAAKTSKVNGRTPRQLWSAVQGGNAQAAVALADLYIRGDGVPVNCEQARVLLLFASERRNAEAIKKLHQLDTVTGCPAP
jgi:hypothetical protein